MSTAQPDSQPPDYRRWVLGMVARSYAIGPSAEGGPVFAEWLSQVPGDTTWPPEDVAATVEFLANALVMLAFEVDDAQAGGRPVDVAGFLERQDMLLVLLADARAEGVTGQEILDRITSSLAARGGPGPATQ